MKISLKIHKVVIFNQITDSYPQFWRYPDGQEIMLSNVELQKNQNQISSGKELLQRVK